MRHHGKLKWLLKEVEMTQNKTLLYLKNQLLGLDLTQGIFYNRQFSSE